MQRTDPDLRLAVNRKVLPFVNANPEARRAQPRREPERDVLPGKILWRLRSPSSGRVTECHLIERSPKHFELRIVHDAQNRNEVSLLFTESERGVESAAVLGVALRQDGWTAAGGTPALSSFADRFATACRDY